MSQTRIVYTKEHWDLLAQKRARAKDLLELFYKEGLKPHAFGSIARGDINPRSDIDIVFFQTIPTFKIEYILEVNKERIMSKEITQATPGDAIKASIFLSELECLTIPLTSFKGNSVQFYGFTGSIDLTQILNDVRLPGINKQLLIIIPEEEGHNELELHSNEAFAAKLLNIDLDFIHQRIRILTKREKIGRTGVFLHERLRPDENFEKVLKDIGNKNSYVRKILMDN